MKTKLIFLFLGLTCTACTQQYIIVDPTALAAKEAAEKAEPTTLTTDEQRETALHEAGHAIVTAALLGPKHVTDIVVRVKCCGGGLDPDSGHTSLDFEGMRESGLNIRSMIAAALGGRAADIEFLGEPLAGAMSDIKAANMVAWLLVNESGVLAEERGGLLIFPMGGAPPFVWREINTELMTANEKAKAIVHANRQLILQLAGEILRQPVKDNVRTLSGEQLRAFLKDRSLVISVAPPAPPPAEGEEEAR